MASTSTDQASQCTSPVKILTVGSAFGSISNLFSKIRTIDAKHGKFDCVLCLGDFFGPLQEHSSASETQTQIVELLNGTLQGMIHACLHSA
ncbi:hypothetical protein J3R83DRAFT_2206 [Lanmaoa asiatica]|nr:hypothetical protein J3R83DRAFT_2206 [Lanmaoa asiatica]